jgi:hypothetical protein
LLAGDYITLATNSLGQIAISASNLPGTEVYWQSTVANNIFTTGSAAISSSLTVNPAGTGRGLLRVGGLDIGPITGSAQSSAGSPAVLSGDILSASSGVGSEAVVRQEFHIVGFGYESASVQDVFAATYLVMSHVDYLGVQRVRSVTELSRETSGSFALGWDVNVNENCEITVSGSTSGNPTYWYGQKVKEMSLGGITGRT